MPAGLTVKCELGPKSGTALLKGSIIEGCGSVLARELKAAPKTCTFDFAEVTIINSTGAGEWVSFLSLFAEKRRINFVNCPPTVLSILSMLPAFRGDATVSSILADFRCEQCEVSRTRKLELKKDIAPTGGLAHALLCETCKTPMEPVTPLADLLEGLASL